MLDLLLIPAALLLAAALRAVRHGDYRLHGHLMTGTFTIVGLRVLLYPRGLVWLHLTTWLLTLAAAGLTILLGRRALAWRETRSFETATPRLHRLSGVATLSGLAITTLLWLLRSHR
jgi:hypothetical protein